MIVDNAEQIKRNAEAPSLSPHQAQPAVNAIAMQSPEPEEKPVNTAAEPQKAMGPNVAAGKSDAKHGRIISIVSVKGGVGKTTIASNLSALISKEFRQRVLLVDGDLRMPAVGFHLNILDPEITLHDVLKGAFPPEQAVYVHEHGLHVIPGSLSDMPVSSKTAKDAVIALAAKYDWVIIDTMPCVDEDAKNLISASDEMLIVCTPDMPGVTASLKAVKLSAELKLVVRGAVLNRVRGKDYELGVSEIEETLGVPVLAVIPEDPQVLASLSERRPVVAYAPASPASREFERLAAAITGGKGKDWGKAVPLAETLRVLLRR